MIDVTFLKKLKVGDKIQTDCYSGMGSGGEATVTNILTKYHEHNGNPYKVIECDGGQLFSEETGEALTPPYMYHIAKKV